jgi:hypothetical protein
VGGGTLIEGPCLVVDHILKLNKSSDIKSFVATHAPGQDAPAVHDCAALQLKLKDKPVCVCVCVFVCCVLL